MSTHHTSVRTPRVVIKGPEPLSETPGGRAKKITDEDEDDAAVADSKGRIPRITWNLPRTDRLVKWLENNVEDRQRLFSDPAQDAKEGKRRRRTTQGTKTCIHIKMADYIFSVDEDVGIRDDVKVHGAKNYAKVVENRIAILKRKYRDINNELGRTGAGLTVEQIRQNPELSKILDKLILDYRLSIWECLHRFWRTLPNFNFNPHAVSSGPGQDLGGEARSLLFPMRGRGNVSEEDEPENELEVKIEDASLLDVVGGAAEVMDMDIGLGRSDNDGPNESGRDIRSPFAERIQPTLARVHPTSSFAVDQHRAHAVAPPMARKRSNLNDHSRTPLAPTGNGRKSNKRTRFDSPLNSVSSDLSQLAELARRSHDIKMAHLEMKRRKIELQIESERERQRFAAQERALVLKLQMQEKEFEYKCKERMLQYELEIARLKGGQTSSANPVSLGSVNRRVPLQHGQQWSRS